MAERNQKVLDRVQQELEKDATISSRQLYEIAQGVDKSIANLNLRQFNAGYVLPLKRKKGGRKRTGASRGRKAAGRGKAGKAAATPRAAKRSTGSSSGDKQREGVRQALLQLARDVASADGGAKLVDVVGNLDPYVDRVLKAAR